MNKETIISIISMSIAGLILFSLLPLYQEKIDESILIKNHCLKERKYYFRIESWFIFSNKIETTKEKADGIDYECIRWEEEPTIGGAILGQKLIYEKGSIINLKNKEGEKE